MLVEVLNRANGMVWEAIIYTIERWLVLICLEIFFFNSCFNKTYIYLNMIWCNFITFKKELYSVLSLRKLSFRKINHA